METDICSMTLSGTLARDPDIRETERGGRRASLMIRSQFNIGRDEPITETFFVDIWGKMADWFSEKEKGDRVLITGLRKRTYKKQDGTYETAFASTNSTEIIWLSGNTPTRLEQRPMRQDGTPGDRRAPAVPPRHNDTPARRPQTDETLFEDDEELPF